MIKEVIQKGSEILRAKCLPVEDFQAIQPIVQDLLDTIDHLKTMYVFNRGIGLAEPQIGESIRLTVAEKYEGKRYVLVNPIIVEKSGEQRPIREGCISFFDYRGLVPRFEYVKVKSFDQNGQEYFVEGSGNFAMLLQHELDHLDGVLCFDYLPNGEADLFKVT